MAQIYFVDIWALRPGEDGERFEDAVMAESAEEAARDLGSRVYSDGLQPGDAWQALGEDGRVYGTVLHGREQGEKVR